MLGNIGSMETLLISSYGILLPLKRDSIFFLYIQFSVSVTYLYLKEAVGTLGNIPRVFRTRILNITLFILVKVGRTD